VIDFTEDIEGVTQIIRTLKAEGGDDAAEDVAGGLQKLIGLSWSAAADVRQVLFVADAPAHGTQYHDISISDEYPEGDRTGLNIEDQLTLLASKCIGFTVFRMNSHNDIMFTAMQSAYQRGRIPGHNANFIVADVAEQLTAAKAAYHNAEYDDVCRGIMENEDMTSPSDAVMYDQLYLAVSSQL
jgi:hypothetical protein